MSHKIRVAMDLHGTLDTYPELRELFNYAIEKGHEVFIMSGSIKTTLVKELRKFKDLNPKYELISVMDYARSLGIKGADEGYIDDDLYWALKSVLCKKYNIQALIDNEPKFGQFMQNDFVYDGRCNHRTHFILIDPNDDIKHVVESFKENYL